MRKIFSNFVRFSESPKVNDIVFIFLFYVMSNKNVCWWRFLTQYIFNKKKIYSCITNLPSNFFLRLSDYLIKQLWIVLKIFRKYNSVLFIASSQFFMLIAISNRTKSIHLSYPMSNLNTQYMTNPTIVSPVKMEYGWNFSISVPQMLVKSGLEEMFLKFLHVLAIFY